MAMISEEAAAIIVDAIIMDLTDRKGLRQEWAQIDENIQEEIREGWIKIAMGKEP